MSTSATAPPPPPPEVPAVDPNMADKAAQPPPMAPNPNAVPPGPMGGGLDSNSASQQPFHSASLYVGDLAPDVNESLLFEIFNAVGPVSSIRVCRDAITRRSLGYAYVNFHQVGDAERALDTMNYTMIKSKPCRIMWSQRDPSLRRSGVGNIFVKNLQESIDNKQLYDTFSLFGNILSCKVVTDRETGKSKGYGYVHYETAEAAHAAIDKLDGMLIDGQEVQVGHFMRRNERPGQNDWTNCYVKNLPLEWDDARLRAEFSKFGEVLSAAVSKGYRKKKQQPIIKLEAASTTEIKDDGDDDNAASTKENEETESAEPAKPQPQEQPPAVSINPKEESLGFGFVSFAEHESAVAAIEALNGKEFETKSKDGETTTTTELYVGRAQKKAERERELRAKFEAEKMDRISKFQGVNLYVKNLDDTVTDDILRDEFSSMGTITSARVMKDMKDGRSRGFGFVCFSTQEEATRAVNEMNGKLIANKPIFVALAQRREVRRAQLEAQHANRMPNPNMMQQPAQQHHPHHPHAHHPHHRPMGGAGGGPLGYPGAAMPMAYMQRPAGAMQPAYPMMPQMMGGAGGRGGGGGRPGVGYPMMQQQQQQQGRGGGGYQVPYGVMPPGRGGGRGPVPGRGGRGGRPMQQGRGGPIKFNQQARNAGAGPPPPQQQQQQPPPPQSQQQQQQPQQQQQQQALPPHEGALTASALASATPEMQKNMIGERLYPLIHASQPELAGKITGMLLEMDNSELLHLLESPDALNSKISEALQVLEAHNATTKGGP